MTTLALMDFRADEAIQPRLKWSVDEHGNWTRYVIARSGNTEHFIRAVPDLDLTERATPNASKDNRHE